MDSDEKVSTFIQMGERSDALQYVKSLSLTNLSEPHRILDTISRKASLETLCLHRAEFHVEPLAASLLSRLSTVTVLVLRECRFGGFKDFVSFIRCFPLCEVLRLRACTWTRYKDAKLKFGGVRVHDIAPVHLEITNNFPMEQGEEYYDQGRIVGAAWLGLGGLKSFTYPFWGETATKLMLERIAACELLEEIDLDIPHSVRRSFGECEPCGCPILGLFNWLRSAISLLTPFLARIKSLTLRFEYGFLPLWVPYLDMDFPPSPTLERMRIIIAWSMPIEEEFESLDSMFADTNQYPSLKEFEVCSDVVTQEGKKGRDTYESLCMDEYLPRLKAMGKLPV